MSPRTSDRTPLTEDRVESVLRHLAKEYRYPVPRGNDTVEAALYRLTGRGRVPRGGPRMRLFNFGPNLRLHLTRIVDDHSYKQVAWWLNGRLFGFYVGLNWRHRKATRTEYLLAYEGAPPPLFMVRWHPRRAVPPGGTRTVNRALRRGAVSREHPK